MSTAIKDEAQSILMAHNSYMNPLVMIEAKEKMQEDPELQQRIIEQFTYLKKPNTALMLSFFGGMLGLDRLYLSQPVIFIFKLGTVGLFGAWWFLDLFLIKKSTRKVNDIKVKYIIADILPVNPIIQRFKIAMKESKAASNKSKEAWNKMKDDLAENKKAIKADWNKLKEDIAENTKTLKAELAETDAEHEVKKDEIEAEHKAKLEQAKKEKALAEKPLTDPNPYRGNWKTSIFKSQGNNYKAIQMKTLEYVYDQVLEKVVPNMAAGKEIDRWFLPDVRELDDISKINTAFQSLNSHET